MNTREEKLLLDIKKLASDSLIKEINTLKRKLKAMELSRNDWRESANRYQRELLDERNKCKQMKRENWI